MNKKLILGFLFLLASWLFIGIREDTEFFEIGVFLKYRPTFQVYFKSPLGMEDMPEDYPTELIEKERVYNEFVSSEHWSHDEFVSTLFTSVLILGTIYFLIAGLIKQFKFRKKATPNI